MTVTMEIDYAGAVALLEAVDERRARLRLLLGRLSPGNDADWVRERIATLDCMARALVDARERALEEPS